MRSKVLLVSNIFVTVYTGFLLWIYGGAIISAGGTDFIRFWQEYFEIAFKLVGFDSVSLNIVYSILVLLAVHILTFVIGMLIGWIGYLSKKSGLAKLAAVLYLVGTICFPIYIFICLPPVIIGFVAGAKQKKINNKITIEA